MKLKLILTVMMFSAMPVLAQDETILKIYLEFGHADPIIEAQLQRSLDKDPMYGMIQHYCPKCVATAKKESADYVIRFVMIEPGNWHWFIYNKDGSVFKKSIKSMETKNAVLVIGFLLLDVCENPTIERPASTATDKPKSKIAI